MAGTHHVLLYHFVFSTKSRQEWIEPDNQEEHHRTEDSRSEYLRMLGVHGIEYDLRYIDE